MQKLGESKYFQYSYVRCLFHDVSPCVPISTNTQRQRLCIRYLRVKYINIKVTFLGKWSFVSYRNLRFLWILNTVLQNLWFSEICSFSKSAVFRNPWFSKSVVFWNLRFSKYVFFAEIHGFYQIRRICKSWNHKVSNERPNIILWHAATLVIDVIQKIKRKQV